MCFLCVFCASPCRKLVNLLTHFREAMKRKRKGASEGTAHTPMRASLSSPHMYATTVTSYPRLLRIIFFFSHSLTHLRSGFLQRALVCEKKKGQLEIDLRALTCVPVDKRKHKHKHKHRHGRIHRHIRRIYTRYHGRKEGRKDGSDYTLHGLTRSIPTASWPSH